MIAHHLLSAMSQLSQATCSEISAAKPPSPHPRTPSGCPGSAPTGTARWINMGFGPDKDCVSPHPAALLASTSSKAETGASYGLCATPPSAEPNRLHADQDGTDGEEPVHRSSCEFAQTAHAARSSPQGHRKTLDGASKQKRPIGCQNDRDPATIGSVTSRQRCSWGRTPPAPHGHVQTHAAAPMKSRTLTKMRTQTTLHQTASLRE